MKLSINRAKFCPGCPKKELVLNNVPKLIITPEETETTKKITILSNTKKQNPAVVSLF